MTKPPAANSSRSDGPRTYTWPRPESGLPAEFNVISVTSAKDVYPKPWLIPWAVKMTAERAVDKIGFLTRMVEEDPKGALKWLKDARWSASGDKADRGTVVHSALEAYIAGRSPTKADIEDALRERRVPAELWKGTHGMIAGLLRFLDDEEPEVYWSETTVYSRTHGYAGTPDVVGRMRIGGERVPVIIDVKTSKSIYDDTALQLVGYARAEFVGAPDGRTELPLLDEFGDAAPRYGVVVRPMASGSYEPAVFELTDDVFELFLACLHVAVNAPVVKTVRRAA